MIVVGIDHNWSYRNKILNKKVQPLQSVGFFAQVTDIFLISTDIPAVG